MRAVTIVYARDRVSASSHRGGIVGGRAGRCVERGSRGKSATCRVEYAGSAGLEADAARGFHSARRCGVCNRRRASGQGVYTDGRWRAGDSGGSCVSCHVGETRTDENNRNVRGSSPVDVRERGAGNTWGARHVLNSEPG